MMRTRPSPSPSLAALAVACSIVAGCADTVPDPKGAVDEYRRAAERGDGDALYAMLTEGGQRERSREDIKRTVAEQRGELAERGKLLAAADTRVEAVARLRFDDGEEATLDLRQGRFQVTASGALPGGARTPEQALVGLRQVLARRSYAGLMRVLSPSTRAAVENDPLFGRRARAPGVAGGPREGRRRHGARPGRPPRAPAARGGHLARR
jgi:hypothetical protein